LILLPSRLLSSWRGRPVNAEDRIAGDYARAIEVREYIGKIPVGSGEALVLGDEPLPASLGPLGEKELVIIRWIHANDDQSADTAVDIASAASCVPEGFLFENAGGEVVLFDSAFPGQEAKEVLRARLEEGTYAVGTAEVRPDPETHLLVHKLERL
jgi:hypothetical protein